MTPTQCQQADRVPRRNLSPLSQLYIEDRGPWIQLPYKSAREMYVWGGEPWLLDGGGVCRALGY